ncbi:MAG: hypothetical protein JO023_03660, partial [Chloroflexi bacterium]|nr:hypothetical protein [Chloroflexota bacterium]
MADASTHTPSGSARVLHRGRASLRARFVQPVVAKHGGLFLLSTDDGDVQPDTDQGLYFHDMRYLSAESLRLDERPPVALLADATEGDQALFELTNPDLEDDNGAVRIRKEALGIRREKRLGDRYTERITIENYLPEAAEFTLHLAYQADFADMFVVRGMHPGKRGRLHAPRWQGSTLTFRYDGADERERTATLHFSRAPDTHHQGELSYHLCLKGRRRWQLTVTCALRDARRGRLESRPDHSGTTSTGDRERAQAGALGS